jgi:hypothetical protein
MIVIVWLRASDHVRPKFQPTSSRPLLTGLRSSSLQTKSQDSRHPHSPPALSPLVPSSSPPRNTYSAPSISVPAYQGGYTMCASTAFSYQTHILGPTSGTSYPSLTLRTVLPMESRGSRIWTLGFLPNLRSFGLGFSYNGTNWDRLPDKTRAALLRVT